MSIEHEDILFKVRETIAAVAKRLTSEVELDHALVDDLGIDSIQILELLSALEDTFGFELDVDDIRPESFRSVQAVLHFVERKVAS
ncbi:phosphopantetheine-binding protein [Paenibacillus sp. FSL P4-0338]|uniref:acyl carrier protein n=1 Tax=unclassified Paenibacillus TaxID=185978 RepID=UPI0004B31EF0|nr:phosphopantetheine-binding protein [Paenibacillus sp. FSL R7-269]